MFETHSAKPGRIYWLVAFVAVIVFANALKNGLVYDSSFMMESNVTFREIAQQDGFFHKLMGLGRLFHEGFWDGVNRALDPSRRIAGQALYRPLMMVVLGASYLWKGASAQPLLVLNLIYHVLASLLVTRLAYRLAMDRRVAAIAGLLFAAHPLHSEAVAYVVGLGETQATMFSLLALLLYGNAVKAGSFKLPRYALCLVAFTIAIFTKENAAILLVLLPLFDLARRGEAPALKPRLFAYLGFAVVVGFNVIVRYNVLGTLKPDPSVISQLDNPLIRQPFMVCLATGCTLFTRVLHLFVVPWGQSADYSFNELPIAKSLGEPAAMSAFAVLAAMTLGGLMLLRKVPAIGFGLLFFLFAFGPVSNIFIQHGTIFGERLTYFPTVGLCLATGAILVGMLSALEKKSDGLARATRATLTALLVLFCVLCAIRNRAYATNTSIYEDMVKTAPGSARAWYLRGENERRKKVEEKAGDIARAIADYKRAIDIWTEFYPARITLAKALAAQGEIQNALLLLRQTHDMLPPNNPAADPLRKQIEQTTLEIQGLIGKSGDPAAAAAMLKQLQEDLEAYLKDHPDDVPTISQLFLIYKGQGQSDVAERLVRAALLAKPDNEPLALLLASHLLSVSTSKEQSAEAMAKIVQLEKATDPEVRNNAKLYHAIDLFTGAMAALQANEKERYEDLLTQAEKLLDEYIANGGTRGVGYYHRALIRERRGRLEDAEKDLQESLRHEPSFQPAFEELARVAVALAQFNDTTLKFFESLEKDQPTTYRDNAEFQYGFGLLYEGLGKLEEAISRIDNAIRLGLNGSKPFAKLGSLLSRLGRYDECALRMRDAEKTYKLSNPDLLEQEGAALFELKRFDEAVAVLKRGLESATSLAQNDPATWGGWVPQMKFQLGKTKLRLENQESEGFQLLQQVLADYETQIGLAPKDSADAKIYKTKLAYTLRQLGWGLQNGKSQRDVAKALETLNEALRIVTEVDNKDAMQDIGEDLREALIAAGKTDDADKVNKALPKPK